MIVAIVGLALTSLHGPLGRILGIAAAGPVLVGGLQLFYGVPLRGRGVGSKVFWRMWAIACGVLLVLWLLIEARGGADLDEPKGDGALQGALVPGRGPRSGSLIKCAGTVPSGADPVRHGPRAVRLVAWRHEHSLQRVQRALESVGHFCDTTGRPVWSSEGASARRDVRFN